MKQTIALIFLTYLRLIARLQIAKISLLQRLTGKKLTLIGITGSAGKTTTLQAAAAALHGRFIVKLNSSGNSETGIPLDILGLKIKSYSLASWLRTAFAAIIQIITYWRPYDVYLVEMGIDSPHQPKNMDYLLKIIRPQIGVFLNVTPVHLENFTGLDQIAAQKAKLVNSATTAIINTSDPLVKKYTTNPRLIPIPTSIKFPQLFPAIYSVSFGAAIAIAQTLGIDQQTATNNLIKYFKLPPSRSTILKGIHDSTIIDSSYNSSPLAAAEMLKFLATFPSPRVAVLGDMRELGSASAKSHRTLYRQALKAADLIISVGPLTSQNFGAKSHKFTFWWQAADYLQSHLPPKATILVKGSQNEIFLEELVKTLLKNKNDSHNLCRQSSYWLKIKSTFYQPNN